MFSQEIVEDGFVLIENETSAASTPHTSPIPSNTTPDHLASISKIIDKLSPSLRPLNLSIHDNPELGYHEFYAHKVLTEFLDQQTGWTVTPHAYGIETAFVAVYDSGKKGPVVSFNVEYGKT